MYRLAKRQRTKERDRQDFALRQDAIQILEERRHELDIRPTAREMIQTASERRNFLARAASALRKEDQRVGLAQRLGETLDHRVPSGFSLPGVSPCAGAARNKHRAEYTQGQICPEAFLPVVLCRDRPRNSAKAGGKRRPEHNEIQMTRMICEIDALAQLRLAPVPAHLHTTDQPAQRGKRSGKWMHAAGHVAAGVCAEAASSRSALR